MKKFNNKIVLHLIKILKVMTGVKIFFFLKKFYFTFFKSKFKLDNNIIYFLHIGKTGGTLLKSIFANQENNQNNFRIIGLKEIMKLYHLNPKQKYIFSIRNPIDRYMSGFMSRKNKSDLYSKEYYSIESFGFFLYQNLNTLAEELYSKNLIKFLKARIAIRCIPIINENIFSWFSVIDLKKRPPLFIFETSNIEQDWKNFCSIFNFNKNDIIKYSHMRNKTIGKKTKLSNLALNNIKKYYKKDFEIYEYCLEFKSLQIKNTN